MACKILLSFDTIDGSRELDRLVTFEFEQALIKALMF